MGRDSELLEAPQKVAARNLNLNLLNSYGLDSNSSLRLKNLDFGRGFSIPNPKSSI